MEPISIAISAGIYVAAAVGKHIEDEVLAAAWKKLKAGLNAMLGREATPQDVTPEQLGKLLASNPSLFETLTESWGNTQVLRRAALVQEAIRDASILWIDDEPSGNSLERRCLNALGAHVHSVESSESAMKSLSVERYDVILSDIAREGSPTAGLDFLPELRARATEVPVIFYIGRMKDRGAPTGAFGITSRPDELLHLCMDVLERRRL